MRELGIIPEERHARALADFLLTREIATQVVANRDGRFAVWVQNEDRLPEAREVYAEFQQDPDAERFHAASRSARALRKQAEAVEKEHRRKSLDLRDRWEGPLHRRAPLTFALTALSIAAFIGDTVDFRTYGWLSYSVRALMPDDSVRDLGFANILRGEVWRLVTPIFMHFGGMHILFNMMALVAFGQRIEMARGRGRFLALVLIAAVLSNTGQYLFNGGGFGGMSGVCFALAGYLWVKGQVAPEQGLSLDRRNAELMFVWFLLGVFAPVLFPGNQGFPFNMANVAHGVGLLAGMALAALRL